MSMNNIIRALAGFMVMLSLALYYFLENEYWLFLTLFVGVNLFQSSFTKLCPAEFFIKKLGLAKEDVSCSN